VQFSISTQIKPAILKIQGLLKKIDRLHLPSTSRRDLESILVRQASKEIDRALPWQAGHGRRTAFIALMIAQHAGMTDGDLHALKLAAYLHDIGLLMLPHDVIVNRQALEAECYVTVQNHPRFGSALLERFAFLQKASVLIAHHHERWDGTGYPYGIRGLYIPLGAKILSIADAFDAVRVPGVSDRNVRNRIALRVIRVAAGSQFDPNLVDLFSTCCAPWLCDITSSGRYP
jgi:HD-GYP domain-containing protein (c-di-GMP phosphodiesterase class II)